MEKSNIEYVKQLAVSIMDRDEDTIIPVSMIDRVEQEDNGWEIHCDNGWNYRIGSDGHLYEVGKDA